MIPEIFIWLFLAILFYCYLGYGLLLSVYAGLKNFFFKTSDYNFEEDVTIIVASYNEENVLQDKIENTLALNYPLNKLQIIFISDGSDDSSEKILQKYPQITVLHQSERKGKAAALNRAMKFVQTPITVFTDANSLLNKNSIKNLVKHFKNLQVGAVAGEKKILGTSGLGSAEGFYWQYESWLKKLDAAFYSVVGASGELFAIRTNLFEGLDETTILDDFTISMNICKKGYIIAYEPDAFAVEYPSKSLDEEQNRKIRIAAGAFQFLQSFKVQDLFKHPVLAFQFISRRWLRWIVCPFILIAMFILNIFVAVIHQNSVYDFMLILQLLFYTAAFAGFILFKMNKNFIITTIPFYFVFMNWCMIEGLLNYLRNKHSVMWVKAERTFN